MLNINKCKLGIIKYPNGNKYIGFKKIIKKKNMEYYIILMEENMKENLNLKIQGSTGMENIFYQMEINMKENL